MMRLPTAGLEQLVADALGLPPGRVTDATAFRSVPEWDSLAHVELMLALEEHWGIEIGAGLVTRLTSVGAIRQFAQQAPATEDEPRTGEPALQRGLGDVLLDETRVSSIDGQAGRLSYRGYSIDDLVEQSTFEETAFLLVGGRLPSAAELADFSRRLEDSIRLPEPVQGVLEALTGARPVDALRTGLSALGPFDPIPADVDDLALGSRLIGRVAALVTEHHARRSGATLDIPAGTGHAARLLWSLTGRQPAAGEARAFDRCLVLLAEHGSNASAFAGRVATGTQADAYAALTSAVATFAGALHGGAIEGVNGMIEEIGQPARAAAWITAQRARRQPVFGFGHRIYRTEDPRAPHLRRMAAELSRGADNGLAIVEEVRRLMADRARHGLDVNVDLYAGLVFGRLGITSDLFIPVFAASRAAGWVAHLIEQRRNNVLIRPRLRYAGETDRAFVPIGERRGAVVEAAPSVPATPVAARLLHTGFVENAARSPHALALRLGARSYTYGELDDIARRWAGAILETAGRPVARVGVFGARSEASYAGTLAALLAGAAFVPLSPDLPVERSRRMIAAARLDALIADGAGAAQLAAVLGSDAPPVVLLPDGGEGGVPAGSTIRDAAGLRRTRPLRDVPLVGADSTAYLMFTSGSTGQPKGVPISHANVGHFLDVNLARYGLTPDDRLSQTFQQTFDLSVFDLFMAWSSGAGLCVPQPIELLSPFRFLQHNGVSVWFSVPSLATLLLRKGLLGRGTLPGLRWSLFCGEALPRTTAEAWQAAAPGSIVENLYGPTECTIACTAYRWDSQRSPAECVNGIVPIGRPWAGIETLVVGPDMAPVEPGEQGELAVAGRQTFDGYWNQPEATARAFFGRSGPAGEQRFYRTGDRVTAMPHGDLAFIGRLDQQVQVLGHRVELGEVEAVLRARPGVTDAVAVPWHASAASAEGLTAFVAGVDLEVDALAAAIRDQLPPYMAPRAIHVLEEMPRNASGKIDRRALEAMAEV